ncbi:S-layer homology domain-containing protein, partial [Acetivibrio saccincola]
MGTKITKIISYLLIISMIMTGLAHAAEGLNSSNGIGTYGENFYSGDVQNASNVSNTNISGENQSFPDIKNHWCQDTIEKFLRKNWVAGYDDGLFRP